MSLLMALATAPRPALAIPDDFRVLGDDIADRRELGLEFQSAGGRSRPRGGAPRSSERQGLAEVSYGIATEMEVSAQFPVVLRDGSWRANGLNLEAQYVAPREGEGVYWGARFELGRAAAAPAAESRDSVEVPPILGYRHGGWEAILNASARRQLGGSSSKWTMEPSAKLGRSGRGRPVRTIASREATPGALGRSSIALLAIDARKAKFRINVGAGRFWGAER